MASEKRLIDANLFGIGIALYAAENAYLNDTALDVLKKVASWLDGAPTVDAVEVVRCKDCKHFYHSITSYRDGKCVQFGTYDTDPSVYKDDFCSYGERKDNEAL